jgi:hypothetical protein
VTLQDRDRRALAILAVAGLLSAAIYFWPTGPSVEVVSADATSPAAAEARLRKLREVIATIPGKRLFAEGIHAQLVEREKGIIVADTAAQAQAQLMQLVTRVARAEQIDITQRDLGPIQQFGKDYGQLQVTVSFGCQIEQLVNLLANLASQPELIATHELQVRAGDLQKKTVAVRLTVSGIAPRKLVPERKGVVAF